MKVELPQEYIVQKFFEYAHYPKVDRSGRVYSAGCPYCREGHSFNKKRRFFYIPSHDRMHCKNCNISVTPVTFIMDMSNMSFLDVIKESKEYEFVSADLIYKEQTLVTTVSDILPKNSINLTDAQQLLYFKDEPIIHDAIQLIISRRMNRAINKPSSFYISLDDFVHKNRLCIPFEDENNKIVFYQTRSIAKNDPSPKYLSKAGSEKTIFGINRVSSDCDYIFMFEGPIDSMFVKNGVGIGGVTLNKIQQNQLKSFPFFKKIWVLDNQHIDSTSKQKTKELIESGERVFIWPKSSNFKDFNDLAIYTKADEIPHEFILQNSFSGLQAKLKASQLLSA